MMTNNELISLADFLDKPLTFVGVYYDASGQEKHTQPYILASPALEDAISKARRENPLGGVVKVIAHIGKDVIVRNIDKLYFVTKG